MAIEFACPECGEQMQVPEAYGGTRGKCQKCGANVTAPMPEGARSAGPPQRQALDDDLDIEVTDQGFVSTRPSGADRWCLILSNPAALNPASHAALLAGPLGLADTNAMQVLDASRGILYIPRWGSLEGATGILRSLGIEALAIRRRELYPVPDIERVRSLRWDDEGLTVSGEDPDHGVRTAWDDIIAVNLGHVALERHKKSLDPRAIAALQRYGIELAEDGKGQQKPKADQVIADLVSMRPWLRLRLSPGYLDFSMLGPHRTASSAQNLQTLVAFLVPACPRAMVNVPRATADIMAAQPPAYRSLKAFEDQTLWMINRVMHGSREPGAS